MTASKVVAGIVIVVVLALLLELAVVGGVELWRVTVG